MSWVRSTGRLLLGGLAGRLVVVAPALAQCKSWVKLRLQRLAKTGLLLRALHRTHYQMVDSVLPQGPREAASWNQIENRALLIGESAILLLLRPPTAGEMRRHVRG